MNAQTATPPLNDLFHITQGTIQVGISPNTLRKYGRDGLPLYKVGKSLFVSRSDLNAFIRANGQWRPTQNLN